MNGKSIVAALTALAAIAGSCEMFLSNYDIEFHLEPDRPNVSRTWDDDEEIPREIAENF